MSLSAQTLDPVTVEVVRNKLDGIANEMELTLLKSSFSPIVKEGLDASASLFTLQGETLAQAIAIPIHLATLIPCVARFLDRVSDRGDARGRHLLHERPLSRRHASARHRCRDAGVRARPPDRVRRRHDPPPGRRRHGARFGADQRDGDFSGGHPAAAAETARRRCLQRHAAEDPAAQCAHPRDLRGRPDGAGRGMHGRACGGSRRSPTPTATTI